MSDINTIRDPSIFSNENNQATFRTPFELSDGNVCGFRNGITQPYQTFSPYTSDIENLSDLVNISQLGCDELIKQQPRPIYKCSEDIQGNKYLLFKYNDEHTITGRRKRLGVLNIIDINNNIFEDAFGDLVLDGSENIIDVRVYFDKIIVITDTQILLGNANSRTFFSVDYQTHVQTFFFENNVYILHDNNSEFEIIKFNGNDISTITKTPLVTNITTSNMVVKSNRIELVYTDYTTDQKLTFAEYDLINNEWYGFTLIDLPYEILDVYDNSEKWVVFFEEVDISTSNRVGSFCVEFNINDTTPDILTNKKAPLNFTFENGAFV